MKGIDVTRRQKYDDGFGIIELLLILVIVCMVGFAGWYFMNARDKANTAYNASANNSTNPSKTTTTPSANSTKQEAQIDPYAGWKTYSKNKLEFKYPADWQIDEQTVVVLKSADYKSTGLQSTFVTSGLLVSVSQTDIPQKNITADNFKSSSLYSSATYSNYKTTSINDKQVVQYNVGDDVLTTILFRKDGTRIEASVQTSSSNRESSLKTYNLILKSFNYL